MSNPSDAQKKINFGAIGVYDTLISAYDYDRAATCDGCIAVRDTYRPQFKDGTCPAAQTSALKLTSTGINKATDYEAKYDAFTNVKNRLNNAESDADCNDESTKLQNFYDASPTSPFTGTCFCQDNVKNNVGKLKQNPFSSAENIKKPGLQLEKDLNDKCTWSCTKSITLKEKYTAYTCPSSASQLPTTCEGLPASTCSMDVSVKATGSDVAQTTVKLTQAVQDASTKLLTELGKPSGADVANTIHYSLPCTSYDDAGNHPECNYNVKLSDLLDISNTGSGPNAGPKFVTDLPSNSEKVTDYVFWRVKAGSQEWATWNPKNDAEISFKSPETTVTVEAWTACGQITSITVVVKLYLHRSLTCDHFVDMWSPLTAKLYGEDSYCNVEDSDFSLFNLDYNYDDIIPADDGSDLLKGTYKKVKCNIRVRDSSAPEGSVAEDLLVPETNQAAITKDFAVELVHDPTTAPKTVFRVECTFTRDYYNNENGNGNGDDAYSNYGNSNGNGNGNENANAGNGNNKNANAGNNNGNGKEDANVGNGNEIANAGNGNGNGNENANAGNGNDNGNENTNAGNANGNGDGNGNSNENTNAGNGNGNGNSNEYTNAGNGNSNEYTNAGNGNNNESTNAGNGNSNSNTATTTTNGNSGSLNSNIGTTSNSGNSGNANSKTATTSTSTTDTAATNGNNDNTASSNGNTGNANSNTATVPSSTTATTTNSNGNSARKTVLLSFHGSIPDQNPDSITCFHSFTITDCDRPKLEPGGEKEDVCAYDCADNG